MADTSQLSRRAVGGGVALLGLGLVPGCVSESDADGAATTQSPATTEPTAADVKDAARAIPYNDLMRNSDQYVGEYVHFPEGEVTQVLGDADEGFQFRIYVTPGEYAWEDDVLARWDGERYLEDDIVALWGAFNGLVSYETVMGAERTIPDVTAHAIELLQEA